CTDGGGHVWKGRSVWGKTYTDRSGVRRVQNDLTGFTSAARDATTVDYTIKSDNGNGTVARTVRQSDRAFAFNRGTRYLDRNPRNPISAPGRAKIVVRVGDGNDGRPGCTMTFVQPGRPAPARVPSSSVRAFVTGYTWWDNSPPGSAEISHPVLHRRAGGTGTYADPITMAVGYTSAGPDIPYGTRFYLPNFQKYFIVEDICGACHRPPANVTYKLDLWLDGRSSSAKGAKSCAYRITGNQPVIRNPARTYPVRAGSIC
ncbi:MAG: hypothetical protein L0H26_12385, partial [Microlunatus sp.]|nr:hypothetical protein [Microlunatus sp.]